MCPLSAPTPRRTCPIQLDLCGGAINGVVYLLLGWTRGTWGPRRLLEKWWEKPWDAGSSSASINPVSGALGALNVLYVDVTCRSIVSRFLQPEKPAGVQSGLPARPFFNACLVFSSRRSDHAHHLHPGVLHQRERVLHRHLPGGHHPGHHAPAQHEESGDGGQVWIFFLVSPDRLVAATSDAVKSSSSIRCSRVKG